MKYVLPVFRDLKKNIVEGMRLMPTDSQIIKCIDIRYLLVSLFDPLK